MRRRDEDKQQRIKKAIVCVTLREGINGASIAKIAQEAEVSPATIYVYYANKDEMLRKVFREFSHQSYVYMMQCLSPEMNGPELIESLIRGIYKYTVDHEEAFSFVEQCSRCPSLARSVCDTDYCCDVFDLIHMYQKRGIIRRMSDVTLSAVLFPPVRYLAVSSRNMGFDVREGLAELVGLMQDLLLV